MRRIIVGLVVCVMVLAGAARAEPPRIVADIAPVHSIVARITEGAGLPVLLLPPGASPHGYAMLPADARALSDADLVFWTGATMLPWLGRSLEALAGEATIVDLSQTDGLVRLPFREGARFEAHDHRHGHEHEVKHEDHGHDHDSDEQEHEAHEHEDDAPFDPHLWLDPRNAALWGDAIAARLAWQDPDNAALYRTNADALRRELTALEGEIAARLAPVRDRPFIVFHDAFHYFEARFGVEAVGALTASDAASPGPRRLRAIRDTIRETGAVCVFAEPQQPTKLVAAITADGPLRSGTLDPLASRHEPGAALYPALLRDLAASLAACLGEED